METIRKDAISAPKALLLDSYDNDSLYDFLEAACLICGKNTTLTLLESKSETAPFEQFPK